jgi:hypothetical protein
VEEFKDIRSSPGCTLLARIVCRLGIAWLSVAEDLGFRIAETWNVTKTLDDFRDNFQSIELIGPDNTRVGHKTDPCPDH